MLGLKPCEICGSIAVAKLTTADRKQYGLCRECADDAMYGSEDTSDI